MLMQMLGGYCSDLAREKTLFCSVSFLQATVMEIEVAVMMMNQSGSCCFCLAHFGLAFRISFGFSFGKLAHHLFSFDGSVT